MNWLALHALARHGDGLIEPLRGMMQRRAEIEADPKVADFNQMKKRAETSAATQGNAPERQPPAALPAPGARRPGGHGKAG
jgi:hypothetical protein